MNAAEILDLRPSAAGGPGADPERLLLLALADLHAAAFSGFFLTSLGRPFLIEYYRTVLLYPGGLCLIAGTPARLWGFAAGFLDPPKFYAFLRSRAVRFACPACAAVLRRPFLLGRVMASARRVGARRVGGRPPAGGTGEGVGELASLAVAPAAEGRGLGRALVTRFCETASSRGARRVRLTTDADGNERVRRFYESLGFVAMEVDHREPRRRMQHYELELRSHA